jgi:hypothetical protein
MLWLGSKKMKIESIYCIMNASDVPISKIGIDQNILRISEVIS